MRSYIFTKLKSTILILVLMIVSAQLLAQSTTGIFFQAVARDNYSNPAMNRKIYVQSSIIQTTATGTKLLIEEYDVTTDGSGVFSISIGNGKKVGGTATGLMSIDWSKGPFYLNLKVAITPVATSNGWDYTKEWTDMGTTNFGAVPYALYSASTANIDTKLNVSDTAAMLSGRFAKDTIALSNRINANATALNKEITRATAAENLKLNISDTAAMLSAFARDTISISNRINANNTALNNEVTRATAAENLKLNILDTAAMLNGRFAKDTIALSNRINDKENLSNKSSDANLGVSGNDSIFFPTQRAVKNYIHIKVNDFAAQFSASGGVNDNSILTRMIAEKNVTYSKMQEVTQNKVLGNFTHSPVGVVEEISTTGTGNVVRENSPFLTTPHIGAATGESLTVSGQLHSTVATGTSPFVVTSTTPVANLSIGGNAATATSVITNANLTGDVTSIGNATSIATNAVTTAKVLNSNITYAKIQNVTTSDKVLGRVASGAGVVEEIPTIGTGNVVRAISPILTTPNIGAATGTSLTVSGQLHSTAAVGTAPFVVTSTTEVANLHAATASTLNTTSTGTNSANLLNAKMADNDYFRLQVGGTATNAGYAEIATADDGTEPIYVRQYTGNFVTKHKEATLLDGSGNTQFPGIVAASTFNSTVATGTAPFVVTSTTPVANLHAATASEISTSLTGTNSADLIRATIADNDYFRIHVGGTASNAGYAEIATSDDGNEPIYVRQYTGNFSTKHKEATLLDVNGNTEFPGIVSASSLKSTVATGTAPFTVTSTTPVANLHAATVTTNANLTGDVISVGNATTVGKINGIALAGLQTGILKNTISTGHPSIAVAADFPILNQNTTGTATNVTGVVAVLNGGTGATSAAAARTNLGLIIGTNVQAPLSFTTPIVTTSNTISLKKASATDSGYLSKEDFTSFHNMIAGKIDATQKGLALGVATLGSDGKVPSDQLPPLTLTSVAVVATETAMLALPSTVGTLAIRTDLSRNFLLTATPATTLGNWRELASSTGVSSVNNLTGPSVVLTSDNIAEGTTNKYHTDARARAAINVSSPLSYSTSTGTISMTAATSSVNGYLSAADFTTFHNKQSAVTFGTGLTNSSGTITVNTSQNIATLSNLTTNGIVTTTGAAGHLTVVPTLPVANGGTGTTTITGIVKGNGTSVMTAAVAGTDYLTPTGSAALLTNFPTLNQNTSGTAARVTTNANLTGDVTSVGNATTIAANAISYTKIQNVSATDRVLGRVSTGAGAIEEIATTGTGNVVRATSPVLTTPNIGAATGTSLTVSGQLHSTVATGSAPFSVASTTPVANLSIGGNAATATTVITNANLLGDVTSVGNSTLIAANAVTTAKILNSNITYAKIQNVSATNTVLGRVSTGAGEIEEIATTGSGNVVRATSPVLTTPNIGAATGTSLTVSGQLHSTVAIGTAPFIVTSTTPVANLQAATVTTNANLTGDVTSVGNASTIAANAVTTAKVLNSNITYAKIQNVSATDKILGRVSSGAGVVEEISTTGSGTVVRSTSPTLTTPILGEATATRLNLSGQLVSSVATGTAPFVVLSTTTVANLHAATASQISTTTSGTNNADLLYSQMADNDFFRIRVGGTASNAGFVEIATADDGTEPIYVRQYTGVFGALTRTATLLDGSGNTIFPGSVKATSFPTGSDARIKKNISNSKYGLSTVLQLRPVEYNLKSNDLKQVGFIAQDVQKLIPEVVSGKEGDLEKGEILAISYGNLVPVLTKAIQEESAQKDKEIAALKALLKSLEARLKSLETIVNKK